MEVFLFFWFFSIFFGIFLLGSSMNGIRDKNFILYFSAYFISFWLKIMPGIGFLIFWTFLLCFSYFSFPGRVWMYTGLKFFPLFLGLSHGFWLKIMPGRGFLIFLLFFLEFTCQGRVWAEFGTKFFLSISRPISSVLAKNNARKRFFHFLNFVAIFFRILFPGLSKNGISD